MKKSTPAALALFALLAQINTPLAMAMNQEAQNSIVMSDRAINNAIGEAVEAVGVNNESEESVAIKLTNEIASHSATEITHYLYTHGSDADRAVFKNSSSTEGSEAVATASKYVSKATRDEALSQAIKMTLSANGSHFKMSCGAGLGIGIPLILAGVVVAVLGAKNSKTTSTQLSKDYNAQLVAASDAYAKQTSTLNKSYSDTQTQETIVKQNQKFAEQQVHNGNGNGTIVINGTTYTYSQAIAPGGVYALQISDIYSTRNSITAQLTTLKTTYDAQVLSISQSETADSSTTTTTKGNTGMMIAGGAMAVAGIPFLIAGLSECHGSSKGTGHSGGHILGSN